MADLKKFTTHRPVDPSDPGFAIPGVKLRWLGGRARENSASTDIWVALRKSDLHADLVKHIQNRDPRAFSEGDTIRRGNGELVLAYAPVGEVSKHRAHLNKLAKDQATPHRVAPEQERIGPRDYTKLETYEGVEGSVPAQFLGKNNKPE